jgi:hypothetical protein
MSKKVVLLLAVVAVMVAVFALPSVSLATPSPTHTASYSFSGPHLAVTAVAEWGDGGFQARFSAQGTGPLGGSAGAKGYVVVIGGQAVDQGFKWYLDPPSCQVK